MKSGIGNELKRLVKAITAHANGTCLMRAHNALRKGEAYATISHKGHIEITAIDLGAFTSEKSCYVGCLGGLVSGLLRLSYEDPEAPEDVAKLAAIFEHQAKRLRQRELELGKNV